MLPARWNARMPVLPAALKKSPSKPTPNWSVSNHTDIGPLNVGGPERTGDVGLEPSPVMNTSGDNGSSVSGPVMLPTTQALAAPPGQSTPGVALRLCPRNQPAVGTTGEPERKSGGAGKGVLVRLGPGGSGSIKKKSNLYRNECTTII